MNMGDEVSNSSAMALDVPVRRARVAVCIPTRNRAHYLRQTIESVLAQTFRDFVLVVSDNASIDGTRTVVGGFEDPRVIYAGLESDIGLVANHNRCFDLVESDYVLLLPDDDLLRPRMLETAVRVLDQHPRVGLVHSAYDVIGPAGDVRIYGASITEGMETDLYESGADYIRKAMRVSIAVHVSTTLFRRSALPRVRFEPQDYPPVDLALMLRIALDWDLYWIASPNVAVRIHQESFSASNGGCYTDTGYVETADYIAKVTEIKLRFLEAHRDRLSNVRRLRRRARRASGDLLTNMIGRRTHPERNRTLTWRLLSDACRHDPRLTLNPAAWRLLMASVLGPALTDVLKKGIRSSWTAPVGSRWDAR
jgi:glycosyltransferase involved in cell wall biosynthesis